MAKYGYYTATAHGEGLPAPFNLEPQTHEKCLADIDAARRGHLTFYGNIKDFGRFWVVDTDQARAMQWQRGPWTPEAFARFQQNIGA